MYLLLGTAGCHLCEQASVLLLAVQQNHPVSVLEIDIAEETQWQTDYAVRIPVLYHTCSGRALDWPFTEHDLHHFINEVNND